MDNLLKMNKSILFILLLVIVFALCVGLISPRIQYKIWHGQQDLMIEFFVTDAETELPVKGATIGIYERENLSCSNQDRKILTLVTDAEGKTKHLEKTCQCWGAKDKNNGKLIDKFTMGIPKWCIQIEAPHFGKAELFPLDIPENQSAIIRGHECSILQIHTRLRKLKNDAK